MRNLIAAALVGVATAASADPSPPALPDTIAARPPEDRSGSPTFGSASLRSGPTESPVFGLLVDGGFPDGVGLSAVARPWRGLRADAGVTYNVLGFGVRAGATLLPLPWAVAPLLRAELGHAFESDASGLAHSFGLRTSESLLLQAVSYDYASLQVGLQLGRSERFAFVVQAGLTWFRGPVKNFQAAVRASNPGSTLEVTDPTVSGSVPTASVGFVFFP
jgi:hypothetical protein